MRLLFSLVLLLTAAMAHAQDLLPKEDQLTEQPTAAPMDRDTVLKAIDARYGAAEAVQAQLRVTLRNDEGKRPSGSLEQRGTLSWAKPNSLAVTFPDVWTRGSGSELLILIPNQYAYVRGSLPQPLSAREIARQNGLLTFTIGPLALLDVLAQGIAPLEDMEFRPVEVRGRPLARFHDAEDKVRLYFDPKSGDLVRSMYQPVRRIWNVAEYEQITLDPTVLVPPARAPDDWLDRTEVFAQSLGRGMNPPGRSSLEGKEAPDFALPLLGNGGTVALKDLRGQVVVLDFWATWCAPCRISMPEMQELADEIPDVIFLGVNVDQGQEIDVTVREFLTKSGITMPQVMAGSDPMPVKYQVRSLPTTIVLTPSGKIQDVHVGYSRNGTQQLLRLAIEEARKAG